MEKSTLHCMSRVGLDHCNILLKILYSWTQVPDMTESHNVTKNR